MQVILNYKSLYEAVKIGVVNDGYTPITRMLFFPVFDIHWGIQPCDADGVPYEVNNQNSNSWCKGEEPIPGPVKTDVGKKTTLEALIKYYKSKAFTDQLYEATEDEMYEAVINLVKDCDIPASAKDKLLKVYDSGDHLAFLAHVFQRAIRGENKVASKQRKKKAADKEADSVKSSISWFVRKNRKRSCLQQCSRRSSHHSGTYTANNQPTKEKDTIGSLWLRLLGIDDEVKIIKQIEDAQWQRLTARTFYHMFVINENRISGENSVLKSGTTWTKNIPVPTITSVIYLLTEQN